jgi:hypothetical protein
MNRRQALVLFVVFAALVGAVLLAVFVPGDNVTRLLGVGGFVVAAGKAAFDIWDKAQERKKRDEEKAEKVRATLIIGGGGYHGMDFKVELYNHGSTRVAIKQVALCGKFRGHNFAIALAIPDSESMLRYNFNREPLDIDLFPKRVNLEPKEHAVFYLWHLLHLPDSPTPFGVKDLVGLGADSFRVVVESFNGELSRITGSEIHKAIYLQLPKDQPATV